MAVVNTNKRMLDRPMWEQMSFLPAPSGTSGTSIADDDNRFIYVLNVTSATAASFWRYDTWGDTWQQLATPPTTTILFGDIKHVATIGTQIGGLIKGSIVSFQANGTVCYFYVYDIATNVWSSLGTTGLPAAFTNDACLSILEGNKNGNMGGFHSGAIRTITTSAAVVGGATTISVTALPEALAAKTVLDFGSFDITTTAAAKKGDTSIPVAPMIRGIVAETVLSLPNGEKIVLQFAPTSGGTTIYPYALRCDIPSGTKITVRQKVVLTAAALVNATSITVSPVMYEIPSGATAIYYGSFYLVGNASATLWRFNRNTSVWSATTANSGNAAFPAIPGAVNLGCSVTWMPAVAPDSLYIVRGGSTSNTYIYDMNANTMTTQTYAPSTETFSTGTCIALRSINGRQSSLLLMKDGTGRIFEGRPEMDILEPKMTQWLYPNGTVNVGNRSICITSPDGVEFYYFLLHSTPALVRCAMID